MMKRVAVLAGALLAALVVAAGAAWLYLGRSVPREGGAVAIAGLEAPVEVWRDSLGVPHVWAESERDLALAQGWLHARDRLWQMEILRRASQGRLSEMFGEATLDSDRFLRALGLWRAARAGADALDEEARALVDAYAAGVNAWLRDRDVPLPPEFALVRVDPEPWTAANVIAIEKVMAMDLALYGTSANMARAVARLGESRAELLNPPYPRWGETILHDQAAGAGATGDPPPGTEPVALGARARGEPADGPLPPEIPAFAARMLAFGSVAHASNSWVIGGAHTASGRPILANDMHLALRAPSLWYLMALHAADAGLDVVGMTLPGAPFVVAGHNRAVAWGYTNAMVDDVDLFEERVDPDDPAAYLTPDGSARFERIEEIIEVRGRDAPDTLRLRLTRHGPVLTDVEDLGPGDRVLALRWVAHDPSRTFAALRGMNRARSAAELVEAVADFTNPHQNVVYADTAGDWGYVMGGRVPVPANGERPRLRPVPGWSGAWDWSSDLPRELHPAERAPARGWIVTANNRQTAAATGDRVSRRWFGPWRAARITQMIEEALAAGGRLDASAVHAMQLDVLDAHAQRYRDRAAAAAERAGRRGAAEALRRWDLRASVDSRGAALYYLWLEDVRRRLARDLFGGGWSWMPSAAVDAALDADAVPWAEPGDARARLDRILRDAAEYADSVAAGRAWGEIHRVRAEHALGTVAAVQRIFDVNVGDVPHGGSHTTVNVANYTGRGAAKISSYGPSQRHVVDLGAVDDAGGFILPTGQSGNPMSEHYADQFERWHQGGLWRIPLGRAAAEARAVQRLRLLPREGGR
ncbi:MAG TPA: penicillin acylase family protein [Longimicrobiales bacterium]|nr:penicillin acylase family protein [Longimicrobiales bacterium]